MMSSTRSQSRTLVGHTNIHSLNWRVSESKELLFYPDWWSLPPLILSNITTLSTTLTCSGVFVHLENS